MRHSKLVIASSLLGTMLWAASAFADIPPPDSCRQVDAGKACDNAGDNADQPGTCQKAVCSRATPDGPMTYDCYLCKAGGGGAGGAGVGGAEPVSQAGAPEAGAAVDGGSPATGGSKTTGGENSSGGTSASAGSNSSGSSDDGGCTLVSAPVGSLAGLLASLAAVSLAITRRRRSKRG